MEDTNTVVSNKKIPLTLKSFRLIDFQVYDEKPKRGGSSSDEDSDENSTEGPTNKYKKKQDSAFMIQMFGVNEKGETCCIFVNDYQPFFFVKVNDEWTQNDANTLLLHFRSVLGKYYEESILKAELVDYHKLYGFSAGKKSRFVKFSFRNNATMNKMKNLWYEYSELTGERKRKNYVYPPNKAGGVVLELYESNIPPLLRYFHIYNISPSGWIFLNTSKVRVIAKALKTTTCYYEYVASIDHVKPNPQKETRVPYKICSFDIEASSSHGDFPVPQKTYKRLATNIVDCFKEQLQIQSLDPSRCQLLLQKIIMSAFGFGQFDNIDLVYPKYPPTKEHLKKLISVFIQTTIQQAIDQLENNEDTAHLMTIDSVFEQIKEFQCQNGSGCAGGEDDDENEDGDRGVEEPQEVVVEEAPRFTYKKKRTLQNKIEKNMKIIDVLLSTEYDRETKIKICNDTLMGVNFPPLEGDKTTFIGSTFIRYGETEPYLNHCLVLGSCSQVEGAQIETVEKERDLLLQWTQLIQRENPDIIIGYNIFGFDYEFLFRRSQENHCEREFLQLSRKIGELCANETKSRGFTELTIENTKIMLASGEYDLRYPKISGRLQIDMYAYFRRDFNLSSYKLDDVAGLYISDEIKKIQIDEHPIFGPITELYSQNLTGLHVGDYIHIELSNFTSDYYQDGHKFKVLDICREKEVVETSKGKEMKNTYNVIVIQGHHTIDRSKTTVKWGMAKDDVSPQDIFRLSNGSAEDRAIVAKYCIQDCNLVHHLMNKIDVITGYVEMSRICSVPISFLVFRGQGIKLTSYVAKKCREKNTLMPDLEKVRENDGYEGAIVLPPKCAMYIDNPVACVDYSSLYPSSMISQNFSHDSKVWMKEYDLNGKLLREVGEKNEKGEYLYDNIEGYQYIDIEFDNFKYLRNPNKPKAKAEKTKVGKIVCRWAQFPENKKGIMPSILEELLKARSDTRKMIKTEKDPFMQNILDKRQLGYKVTANSLYGQCGSKTSTFYEKDVAASTTATGRMMIIYARDIIEEVYKDRIYDTETHGPVLTKAEYVYGDSVTKDTPVYVRHKKHVFDICTIEELAIKYGNNIWLPCLEKGKQDKEVCVLENLESWTEKGWTDLYRVIRHKLAAHKVVYRITTNHGIVDVTDDHSLLTEEGKEISPKEVKIGTPLLHCPIPKKEMTTSLPTSSYYNEKMEKIIQKMSNPNTSEMIIPFCSQIDAAYIFWIVKQYDEWEVLIETSLENEYYYLKIRRPSSPKNNDGDPAKNQRIKSMEPIEYIGYVYDLTTENHHFAAGIGNLIVHNTDSVFFTFNLQNPKTGEKIAGKEALEITIEIAQDAAHLCTQWLKPPMELSYEKTLLPFILLSKKRYVGMLYETDPNKGKMKFMGLSLKRRDTCDYLKDVYGEILNILMKEQNISKAITFLDSSLEQLIQGKVSMDKLAITKSLRSDYKNPQQIAHKVLADRIGHRDPGNKPKPGDRIKFVYVVNSNPNALLGERIETFEYILANKLQIDYTYYITNQLMKPLQQLFGLAITQIWETFGKRKLIPEFHREMNRLFEDSNRDLEIFNKKKEKYTTQRVKELLFDPFLTKLYNKQHKIQTISSMFQRMSTNPKR
jgi:DNA polymerase elongation subunit (family B)